MPQTHSGPWDGRPVQSINGLGGILTLQDLGLDWVYTPADQGFITWNFDPSLNGGGAQVAVSGTKYVMRLKLGATAVISNISVVITVAGSTLTSGQNGCALYDANGTQLGVTADQSAVWNTSGVKTMAITPVLVTTPVVYVELMSNGTTPATFTRSSSTANALNVNVSGAALRWSTNGTGATALDASITPSSLSTANTPLAYWVGLS